MSIPDRWSCRFRPLQNLIQLRCELLGLQPWGVLCLASAGEGQGACCPGPWVAFLDHHLLLPRSLLISPSACGSSLLRSLFPCQLGKMSCLPQCSREVSFIILPIQPTGDSRLVFVVGRVSLEKASCSQLSAPRVYAAMCHNPNAEKRGRVTPSEIRFLLMVGRDLRYILG